MKKRSSSKSGKEIVIHFSSGKSMNFVVKKISSKGEPDMQAVADQIGIPAVKNAFKRNRHVMIAENGNLMKVFPDNTKVIVR